MPPPVCLGKPQESWFFHPLLFFPGESGSDSHPYSKRFHLSLSWPTWGQVPGPVTHHLPPFPHPRISYQHFAAPQWLSEEKHGLVLRQRSRGPCGPCSGLDLASGFSLWLPFQALLRSPQTAHQPWTFSLVQPLSHLLDTVYLSAGNHSCTTPP